MIFRAISKMMRFLPLLSLLFQVFKAISGYRQDPNSYSAPPQLIHIKYRLLDDKTRTSAVLWGTQD